MLLAKAPIRTLPIAGQRAAELRALALILAAKAFIFATALISYATQMGWYDRLFADAADGRHFGLEFWFSSWDSSHYIFLADHGYQHGLDGENAFAPLLPMAMRFLNLLTGNSVVSGLLIANIASVAAGFMFYVFVRRFWGEGTALRALILLLAFPTAFFMNMVYTESIFILLVMTSVYFLYQGQTGKAAFAAFLLPLTRWIGILFVATLVVAGALRLLRGEDNARLLGGVPASVQAIFACAMAPVVGAGVYVLLMAALTGDPMAHVHGAHLFPSHWSLGNVVRPDLLVREFFKTPLDVHSHVSSIIDRVFFVAFLASAPLVYRRVDKPLFVYYLSIGLVPLLGSFMSYTRYVLPAFPLYIAYADAFAQKQRLMLVIVVTMVILQYFFIGLHVRNLWVA